MYNEHTGKTGKELAQAVLDSVIAHRDHFDMMSWCSDAIRKNGAITCGTTMCLAGWAVFLHVPKGYSIEFNEVFDDRNCSLNGVVPYANAVLEIKGTNFFPHLFYINDPDEAINAWCDYFGLDNPIGGSFQEVLEAALEEGEDS